MADKKESTLDSGWFCSVGEIRVVRLGVLNRDENAKWRRSKPMYSRLNGNRQWLLL